MSFTKTKTHANRINFNLIKDELLQDIQAAQKKNEELKKATEQIINPNPELTIVPKIEKMEVEGDEEDEESLGAENEQ